MIFGPYPEGYYFYIEKSKTYQNIQDDDNKHGVKIAEFLLLRQNSLTVWIVEAKSSSPRPKTQPNFDNFIKGVQEKLTNALTLFVATHLKRHSTWEELPNLFQTLDLSKASFSLILVIKGHKEMWLPPLQDALKKLLKPTVKTWNLSPTSVVVLNDVQAKKWGLII